MGYDNNNEGLTNWELIRPSKWKLFANQIGPYLVQVLKPNY